MAASGRQSPPGFGREEPLADGAASTDSSRPSPASRGLRYDQSVVTAISDVIRTHLSLHGWPLQRVGWLAPVHGKSGEVTPYYCLAEAPTRPYGKFAITGTIGVIHRAFETE